MEVFQLENTKTTSIRVSSNWHVLFPGLARFSTWKWHEAIISCQKSTTKFWSTTWLNSRSARLENGAQIIPKTSPRAPPHPIGAIAHLLPSSHIQFWKWFAIKGILCLVGGWATYLKNICQVGWLSQYMEKKKSCSKAPTRLNTNVSLNHHIDHRILLTFIDHISHMIWVNHNTSLTRTSNHQ